MSVHTPGPWAIEEECESYSIVNRSFPGWEWCIAEVYHKSKIGLSNANLVAAAPGLLAALVDCRRVLELANFTQELAVVDAAIARAKGEQP